MGNGLHRFVDTMRIREAIARAERVTSAPVHVSIAPYFWGNVRRTAQRAFRKHGLTRTPGRNGVLVFVIPSRREFAIVGDVGAHEALGQSVWEMVAETIRERFRLGDPTGGLESGIELLGRELAPRFPPGSPTSRPSSASS